MLAQELNQTIIRPANDHVGRKGTDIQEKNLKVHDLRNALGSVSMAAESLAANPDPSVNRAAGRIERAVQRMLQMCTQASGAGQQLNTEDMTLDSLISDAVDMARDLADPFTHVEWSLIGDCGTDQGDGDLFRLLANLLINATQATNRCGGGMVLVEAMVNATAVWFRIHDEADGIIKTDIDVKKRESSAQRRSMGMVIALALAEKLGGSLSMVQSTPDGSTLEFFVSRSRLEADA